MSKNQGIVWYDTQKGNYKCFQVLLLWKHGMMHSETPHTIQHSVLAFDTLPAQFALLMSCF